MGAPRRERRQLSLRQVVALLLVVAVVVALLGAGPLKNSAENISSPIVRSVALGVARPIAAASGFLRLDGARRWVLTTFGGQAEEASTGSITTTQGPPTSGFVSVTTTSTIDGTSTAGSSTSTTTVTSSPSTTRAKPAFTVAKPLRLLLVGDSLMIQIGHGVTRSSERLRSIEPKVIAKYSSGLSRPEFYDWPATIKKTRAEFRPDVTVMMFGDNDKVDMTVGEKKLVRFTPEWLAEYRRRVAAAINIITDAGGHVIWIGMPIMRGSRFSETARTFNKIYSEVCAATGSSYIDTYTLFSDGQGHYSPYLPDSSGKSTLMRAGDGIHLSEAGGDRVAAAIVKVLRRYYGLQ